MRVLLILTPTRHTLSVTLMSGQFLAYLEPMVTGSEKESDLSYLFELARNVKRSL